MLENSSPNNIREPYCKFLGEKLCVIQIKGRSGIARAMYIHAKRRKIVILHVLVKRTQKTPQNAINIAKRRLKEVGNSE